MYFLYSCLLFILSPFLLFSLYRTKAGKPKVGKRWKEHFGITPALTKPRPIWLHAVSVGEVIAAKPLIKALLVHYPNDTLLVTTTTATGAALVDELSLENDRVVHRYMPIDFGFAVRGFLRKIKPKAFLIMETELWPNTLKKVQETNIPILVLNARLSERAMKGYQKIQPFFSAFSAPVCQFICQFESDAAHFSQLAIKSQKIAQVGSLKFDLPTFNNKQEEITELEKNIGKRPVWLGASTHSGEDEILLKAHKKILAEVENALLILVPRHPERFNDVAQLIEKMQFNFVRRSDQNQISPQTQVYLADTLGEMMLLLSQANLVFMGGSLLGKKVGGHNVIEPASLGKPLLIGESFYNFQVITSALIEAKACQICQNESQISAAVIDLLTQPQKSKRKGEAAIAFVKQNQGALDSTLSLLRPWLK